MHVCMLVNMDVCVVRMYVFYVCVVCTYALHASNQQFVVHIVNSAQEVFSLDQISKRWMKTVQCFVSPFGRKRFFCLLLVEW